jgi:hypothetical protein
MTTAQSIPDTSLTQAAPEPIFNIPYTSTRSYVREIRHATDAVRVCLRGRPGPAREENNIVPLERGRIHVIERLRRSISSRGESKKPVEIDSRGPGDGNGLVASRCRRFSSRHTRPQPFHVHCTRRSLRWRDGKPDRWSFQKGRHGLHRSSRLAGVQSCRHGDRCRRNGTDLECSTSS